MKRSRVKSRNLTRHNREWVRAFGSAERVAFVASLPSVVSGEGPCQNVHVRGGGAGRKADAKWVVPMTMIEHGHMHQTGQQSYAMRHNLDLDALAEATEAAWQSHLNGAF